MADEAPSDIDCAMMPNQSVNYADRDVTGGSSESILQDVPCGSA